MGSFPCITGIGIHVNTPVVKGCSSSVTRNVDVGHATVTVLLKRIMEVTPKCGFHQ